VPEGGVVVTSSGVGATDVTRDFAEGTLRPTGRDLDFAINGDGFFRVLQDDGSMAYTRDGNLQIDANRRLVTPGGQLLDPDIAVPATYHDVRFMPDGRVTALRPYTAAEEAALGPDDLREGVLEEIGRIRLSRFSNPEGLESIGRNLYIETAESQPPIDGFPTEDGMGVVHSGFLEASNVDVATEMTMLVLTSRAYQLNLNAYRTIEQMLAGANQLAG
jgi:flagellar basal-body rod protein FlgG